MPAKDAYVSKDSEPLFLHELLARTGDSRPVGEALIDWMQRLNPDTFQMFYPKCYEHLHDFHSPKCWGEL